MEPMRRYANGKIYKIVNDVDDQIFVGSTCKQRLCQRMAMHRADFCRFLEDDSRDFEIKLYFHILEIGQDHFRIELIENYACETKEQLRAREGHWLSLLHPSLNIKITGITLEEYRLENVDAMRAHRRKRQLKAWRSPIIGSLPTPRE